MSRGWRLIEFDIVAPPPADDIVALSFGVSFEAIEIVAPLLDRDEARPVAPGASAVQDGCVDGGIACGIFGAVLIAGEVAAAFMYETVHRAVATERR